MGFLSGWSSFLVTFSGAIAFLAVIFNGIMSFFFPVLGKQDVIFSAAAAVDSRSTLPTGTLFSIFAGAGISGLHCIGVRQGTLPKTS